MTLIKSLDRSAGAVTLAFCPEKTPGPALLAAGTVAGAVDVNFSTSSVLELVALDFASPVDSPPVLGTVQAPERFNRLAWGQRLAGDPSFPPTGLLAGGLADGSVCLWDPSLILSRTGEGRSPLLAKMQKHTGAVKGLEFNLFSPNLLASGAADSDLCIWDLAKPATPSLYPALKGTAGPGGPSGNEITHIAWNRKVQHILGSCSSNGMTVVWDLKKQKPVISFRDPNSQRRASVLQWNPEVATQLVVASDDDRSPTLQMWDLRNSVSPLKEFVGHSKGVLGMAWSPHDPSLLLSCGKDHRNICWDVHTADIVCELPSTQSGNFDIQWAPHTRGVFATACFDGRVGVYNLHACTGSKVVETVNPDFSVSRSTAGESTPLKRVPVWMKRPCSATFGFGGKLVSVTNHKVSSTDASGQVVQRDQAVISIKQVVTEPDLVQRSEQFEQAISGGDRTTLQSYCVNKAEVTSGTDPEEAETWSFLALLFEANGRRELLKKLGFADVLNRAQSMAVNADANGNAVAAGVDALNLGVPEGSTGGAAANGNAAGHGGDDFFGGQDDDPNFFDNLPDEGILAAPVAKSPTVSASQTPFAGSKDADGDSLTHRPSHVMEGTVETSHELEDEIQRAMIAGNYESAVESCFKAHRLADALLIANIFNSDLFKRTMHRYMKLCPKPYMNIIRANVDGDWEQLVRTRPVGQWRETLALLATYTAQEDWFKQCEVLAGRLAAAGMHHAALLCHICAGNVDAAVASWAKFSSSSAQIDKLQTVIEKSVIMGLATNSGKGSAALSDLVTAYASLLATQGRMTTAFEYLDYAPGEASTTVAVLRDRIYRSGAAPVPQGRMAPPFPFVMEDVKPVPIQRAAPAPIHTTAPTHQHTPATTNTYDSYGQQYQNSNQYPAANQYTSNAQYQQPQIVQTPTAVAARSQPAYGNNYPQYTQASAYGNNVVPPTGYGSNVAPGAGYGNAAVTNATYGNSAVPTMGYGNNAGPPAASNYTQPNYSNSAYPAQQQQQQASAQPQFSNTYQNTSQAGYGATNTYANAPTPSFTPTVTQVGTQITPTQPQTPAAPPAGHKPVQQPIQPAPRTTPIPPPASTPASGYAPGIPPAPISTQAQGYTGYGPPPGSTTSAAAAPPPGPPANISVTTADTSKVPADQRAIVVSLTNLYNSCVPLATNPAKKREMDDNTKKVGQLFWRLNSGEVSEGVVPKLLQLCQAIDAADWHTANHIQVQMTTTDWEECGFWLSAVKRLIKMRQMVAQ